MSRSDNCSAAITVPPVVSLSDKEACLVDHFGAKGSRLAQLYQAGFPVPPAFLVSVDALSPLLIGKRIREVLQTLGTQTIPAEKALRIHSEMLVDEILVAPFPTELLSLMSSRLNELGCIAVRSSALREDGFQRSGAGQYETVLGVSCEQDLVIASRRIVASQYSLNVLQYWGEPIFLNGGMAVILQKMVPAIASGVIFTRDPVTQKEDILVIEACFGLGTSVVQGRSIAQRTYIKRNTCEIVSQELRMQTQKDYFDEIRGTVIIQELNNKESTPAISHSDIISLVEMACEAENYIGVPLDIEWAIDQNELYLLQARPITGILEGKI